MSPTRPCPRCRRLNFGTNSFCSSCGAPLSAPAVKVGWKLIAGALAVFTGVLWAGILYTQPGREPAAPQPPARSTLLDAAAPTASPTPARNQNAARPPAAPQPTPVSAATGESAPAKTGRESSSRDASANSRAATSSGTASSGTTSSDDYYTNVDGVRVHRPVKADSAPSGATAQCRDGSYSFSLHRSGTCSHHGGVARWL